VGPSQYTLRMTQSVAGHKNRQNDVLKLSDNSPFLVAEIGVRCAHLHGPDKPRPAAAGPGKKDIEKQNDDMFGLSPSPRLREDATARQARLRRKTTAGNASP
jgi:hypothetical protein